MVISAVRGFAAGIGITVLLQRRRRVLASKRTSKRTSKERSIVLNAPQLLAWIDAATQGWTILAPDHSIAYINDWAELLPHIPSNRLDRGMQLRDFFDFPVMGELLFSSRY